MKGCDADELAMEVTVLSAQDLNNSSSLLLPGSRLRPFVALFAAVPSLDFDRLPPPLHCTRVDERGAHTPAWGDKIRLPLDPSFLHSAAAAAAGRNLEDEAGVYLCVLSKRPLRRPARLGWCRIPPADVLDGLRPPSALRRLSYALRSARHGGRGRGVIHVAVRLLGRDIDRLMAPPQPRTPLEQPGWCQVAIGIPIAAAFPSPGCACGGGADRAHHGGFSEGRAGGVGFDFGLKS